MSLCKQVSVAASNAGSSPMICLINSHNSAALPCHSQDASLGCKFSCSCVKHVKCTKPGVQHGRFWAESGLSAPPQVHAPQINTTRLSDSHVIHTGQFFFPEEILSQLESMTPYTQDTVHRVLNKDDHDFKQDPTQVLDMTLARADDLAAGATGKINVVIDQFRAEVEPVAHESMLPVAR